MVHLSAYHPWLFLHDKANLCGVAETIWRQSLKDLLSGPLQEVYQPLL